MKKIIILASALLLLASCKKEDDICGDSTFEFKLYAPQTKLIAYVNGNLVGEFGNEVTIKKPIGTYFISIIQQRTINFSTIIFYDTIELKPCKDIFSYKY
jgi:hypothetical protein